MLLPLKYILCYLSESKTVNNLHFHWVGFPTYPVRERRATTGPVTHRMSAGSSLFILFTRVNIILVKNIYSTERKQFRSHIIEKT